MRGRDGLKLMCPHVYVVVLCGSTYGNTVYNLAVGLSLVAVVGNRCPIATIAFSALSVCLMQ